MRRRKNLIRGISDGSGKFLSTQTTIQNLFNSFSISLWEDASPIDLSKFNAITLPHITDDDHDTLLTPLSLEEVHKTVFSMPKGKATGPDGFNMEFLTYSWDIIASSLFNALSEFFESGSLTLGWDPPLFYSQESRAGARLSAHLPL